MDRGLIQYVALVALIYAVLAVTSADGPSGLATRRPATDRSAAPGSRPDAAPLAGARDPVGALVGRDLAALRRLLRPGPAAPRLMPRIATLLDDQDGGDDDRIDPGLEALHLATFLHNEGHRRWSRAAIARYRARTLPHATSATRLASELSYDVKGAELSRRSHHDETARYWRPHFDRNRRQIMRAVALMKQRRGRAAGRPLVMALGAGSCADIPLGELVNAGCDVILVDLDQASLKKGIAMHLPPTKRRHVRLELRDLSGGVVDAVCRAARRIIERNAAPERARAALDALFKRQRASVPQLEGEHRVDLLISSLLIGQLPVFPVQSIGRRFQRRFGEPLARSNDDMLAQSVFGDRLFDAHIEALGDLVVRSRAVVYFSSDLFMMPSFYDLRARKVRYGPPRPVMGYHGQPLLDLDLPFEGNPALEVVSGSASAGKSSDFWIWDQEPAQLAPRTSTVSMPDGRRTGKKGMARAIDSVILLPARDPGR